MYLAALTFLENSAQYQHSRYQRMYSVRSHPQNLAESLFLLVTQLLQQIFQIAVYYYIVLF